MHRSWWKALTLPIFTILSTGHWDQGTQVSPGALTSPEWRSEQSLPADWNPAQAPTKLETSFHVFPGQRIQVEAGGCTRAGTSYAQQWSRAMQGLIFVPGVTMAFVPLGDIAGKTVQVAESLQWSGREAT